MRCRCCDVNLTDYECSLRGVVTNKYLDTCVRCLKEADIAYVGNPMLSDRNPDDEDDMEWLDT